MRARAATPPESPGLELIQVGFEQLGKCPVRSAMRARGSNTIHSICHYLLITAYCRWCLWHRSAAHLLHFVLLIDARCSRRFGVPATPPGRRVPANAKGCSSEGRGETLPSPPSFVKAKRSWQPRHMVDCADRWCCCWSEHVATGRCYHGYHRTHRSQCSTDFRSAGGSALHERSYSSVVVTCDQ